MMEIWTLHSNLLLAIQDNDLESAEDILRQDHVDPDVKFNMGYGNQVPAICLCVERGLYQMAKLLIDYGCSVNQTDDLGYSPLHFAASHQFMDLMKLLVTNRANVNSVSNYGHTPLHLACQQSSVEIVQMLVESGGKTDKKDSDGRTPLCMACICNQTPIVKYLVQVAGADVNVSDNYGNSPLIQSINSGLSLNYDLIKILLNGGADPNHKNHHGLSPLITTIRRSSEHCLDGILTVNDLIDHGCQLNDCEPGVPYGQTAIHLSISRGQDRITETLIRSGADVNSRNHRGFSPLHRVATEDKSDLTKILIASGADTKVPKDFWVDDEGIIRNFRDPEIQKILSEVQKVPSLKQLSRVSFRRWLERKADRVIRQLNIPQTLRQYLLLLDS